jgi:SAM-dependent methyltransferase
MGYENMLRQLLVLLLAIGLVAQLQAAVPELDVPLPDKRSIIRLAALPNPVSESARATAEILFNGLDKRDPALVIQAISQLEANPDKENVGGTHSALLWLAKAWLRVNETGLDASRPQPKLDQAYFDFFLENEAMHLKEYLQRKYRAGDFKPEGDPKSHLDRSKFLEDIIIFNNPLRSQWESTEQVLNIVSALKPEVSRVIDLGAGFGYFSEKFAEVLGPGAIVYAADTEETYVEQLRKFVERYDISGIQPILSKPNDIVVRETTDMVFIASLYHVLYGWSQSAERNAFMETLHRTLRPGGYLIVLDNRDHDGVSLHHSFLNKEFALAQLYYYGFELVTSENLSPYRYILVLRKTAPQAPKPPVYAKSQEADSIKVTDSSSVIHIGSLDSFDITPSGIAAGQLMLKALADSDMEAARNAIDLYDTIIPNENFGGEYSALQWIANYLIATESEKSELTRDPLVAEFIAYLAQDDYANLKLYIARKYKLDLETTAIPVEDGTDEKTREIGIIRRQALEDFILFNNPKRDDWEQSPKIMERLPLKPGDRVVDVGSGPGFYSFKFAERVGPMGRVYALDTKESHIEYLNGLAKKWDLKQIVGAVSSVDGFEIPEPGTADLVFMCSLYHILYGVSSQTERDGMIASMLKALKPDGRLVVVDNGPVEEGTLPYHGPYMRQELVASQLKAYGFKLEFSELVIPQRYLMVFSR